MSNIILDLLRHDPDLAWVFQEEKTRKEKERSMALTIEGEERERTWQFVKYKDVEVGELCTHGRYIGLIHKCYVFVTYNDIIRCVDANTGMRVENVSYPMYAERSNILHKAHAYVDQEATRKEKRKIHSVNTRCANTAYSCAREGDLIAACNVIMDALSHGYKVGPFTISAIVHILIENGYVPEAFLGKDTTYARKSLMMEYVEAHNLNAALKALLFHDDDGGCKTHWTPNDRKEFNSRKWELFDALLKEGCKFKRGGVRYEPERI
ncbi:MAG: hypothetical protein M0R06_07435 [Sphaerochaeta sp.]|jgi:hypothetical protein|nr:hypothetical protein [Sphaerochaeta sp.]